MFGKEKEKIRNKIWNWLTFKSTKGFPVSKKLLDWVVGQDRAMDEVQLCIDEWLYKLKYLQKSKWYEPWLNVETEKPLLQKTLTPGPYLLLLGDPGTGKSLIGRAMAEYMSSLYKKHKIRRFDVLCYQNKAIPSTPKISIHPTGEGKKIIRQFNIKQRKKSIIKKLGMRLLQGFLLGLGVVILFIASYWLFVPWITNSVTPLSYGFPVQIFYNNFFHYAVSEMPSMVPLFVAGGSLTFSAVFMMWIGRLIGGMGGGMKGIGGAQATEAPKLLVTQPEKFVPFIDATGHTSAQLFGSIAWDPYQEYSEDTLVLTPNGWKLIGEFEKGDLVVTLNKETGKIEIQPVDWTFSKFIDGKVVNFKNRHFDLIVDQDHAIYNALTKERERAGDYIGRKVSFTRLGDWKGKFSYMSDVFLKFIAWYITEGSSFMDGKHRRIKICQVDNPNNIERIKGILDYLGEKYSYDGKDFRIHYASKGLFEYVQSLGTSALDKKIPPEIKNISIEQLKIFFDELTLGDGWKYDDGHRKYYTSSWRLCADIQEIALKLGWGTTVWMDNRKRGWTKNVAYQITFYRNGIFPVKGKLINYKGNMHCIGVPNGVIFVMRNGKPLWCGNTGGLGTPEHQRVSAGDVHRASMGIFYIDEIKNLGPKEAITLLSVMEDGCLPVTVRDTGHSGTAAMAVGTEPIPALFFLLAAGNFDSINQIHPALMDRLVGYGRVVRMNNDMPNSVKNRKKYIQFIAQESERFHLPPFSREACIEIVNEGRRRSNKKNALVTKFRPLISVIKTAGTLAQNEKSPVVKVSHVKRAINVHCKTIQKQLLEHLIEEKGKLMEIKPEGSQLGQIYGLAVVSDPVSSERTGSVLRVKSQMIKKDEEKENLQGYYKVSGMAKDAKWMGDSAEKVRSVILKKYNIDIKQEYFTHIDFAQAYGVDGPSAGVTIALLLCSLLEGKPIRQDVAVTGEINISSIDDIEITAVGGLHEKIMSAQSWGFKKVVIPKKNFDHSILASDYEIEVVGASSLDEYLEHVLVDNDRKEKR